MIYSPIRYPGSKGRLAKRIVTEFPQFAAGPLFADSNKIDYREPFFGSGAIGWQIMDRLPPSCPVWINDKDYGLIALWNTIKDDPDHIKDQINKFIPSPDLFYKFKEESGRRDIDFKIFGFRKLALHQMSFSGLGAKSGGPLGGKQQDNDLYNISCRWNTTRLINKITKINDLLNKSNAKISCKDYQELIDDNPRIFLYLDPPYVEKGEELYTFSFEESDHQRLNNLLSSLKKTRWLLSYDDHPMIRRLYSNNQTVDFSVTYCNNNGPNRKNNELLIKNYS